VGEKGRLYLRMSSIAATSSHRILKTYCGLIVRKKERIQSGHL